ncbi:neuropilin and tolloid-like isoform X2 [Musca autumnalis]|uniref:neuropilin and tolloid-like isoform X2 n=1 Tax=Musca autumnalis TaxID=221902 RepID=UPI003CE8F767
MKPSSSVSCGCCFCCYCRSWLMVLLMVSSVIHVSPEMMTTITTTTDTNLNNYYKAMTKFAKFNTKLPSQTNEVETSSAKPLSNDAHNAINQGVYPVLQSNMTTTMATMQTHFTISKTPASTRTTATTTTIASLLGQIAMTRQSSSKTGTTTAHIEEEMQNSVYRSSTDNPSTPALIGDNYDVVIRTTDTPDSMHKSTGTMDETGTTKVQIALFHGDNKNLKYPRIESSSSQHHGTTSATTIVTQHTQHPKGNHVEHNNEEVQKTITGQRITATVPFSSKLTKQNIHQPSSSKDQITITSISNTGSDTHANDMLLSSQQQRTHLQYNQLKRPALLAASTQTLQRQTRQVDDDPIDKCRLFEVGDPEKMELYSPDYPNVYPKNINCTRVITAQKGQIIRLDFRNSFHIEEKEDCKFDFLEIRDGQYGFSNLIGKFCGTDFPPEITSKERYLWLHFHSDESIEYSGFTAVYEFLDRTRDAPSTDLNCTIEKGGDEGFVNSTDIPQEIKDTVAANKIALDCMWRIQVQEKWKIQVKFIDFKLSKPNDCDVNFLDIFPEQTVMPLRVKNFCGSAGEGITSESNILHMRFYAEQQAVNSTFSILYTAFRDRGSGTCAENEYDCEDATCIAADLKCNQRDNCKFRWDEEGCEPESKGQSEHMTIIITVFGLILGGMVITFLVNCVRKIMHDQKIIRDVPVLSDGIYHIDSFVLDAPKSAIFVGLQDDYKLRFSPGHHSGHENIMAIDMINDDLSSISSALEGHSFSETSQVDANSINCCSAYPGDDTLTDHHHHHHTSSHDGVIHFDNDEFIIVPQVPQKLITSHCNLHSGHAIISSSSSEGSSNNSSQSPQDLTSEEMNYHPTATALSLAIYPDSARSCI